MEIIIISAAAFFLAILTFFSGFGLGTLLTPVFMIFFPVELAICLTGLVHFFNNIFKFILVWKNINKSVFIRFGIPSIIGAFFGSWLLINISDIQALFDYELFGKTFEVHPVKFIISILLLIFVCFELIPQLSKIQFGKDKLFFGGVLSGFFGGLSGIQGALRSFFLINSGLSKEAFIATTVAISTFVDITRLSIYVKKINETELSVNLPLIACATLSAIIGAYIGIKLLQKVTISFLHKTVTFMLIILSLALAAGLV